MEIDFFLGPTRESESVDDVHIDASEVTISMPKLHVVPVYNLNLVDSKKGFGGRGFNHCFSSSQLLDILNWKVVP